jgi:hypothetical protein
VTVEPARGGEGLLTDPALAEEVALPEGGIAYYRPAGALLRREVDVFGRTSHVHLESNLPREDLLAVAGSLGIEGGKGARAARIGGQRVMRIDPRRALRRAGFAQAPQELPAGYDPDHPSGALVFDSRTGPRTLVVFYRGEEAEYDGYGIRVAQSRGRDLPPASGRFEVFGFRGTRARWTAELGLLEWIDDDVYRSISAPSLDLPTVVSIAESMR